MAEQEDTTQTESAAGEGPQSEGATATAGEEIALGVAEEEEPEVDPTGRLVEPASGGYHWGTGRRKNAVARVRVRPGSGEFQVNGKPLKTFFTRDVDQIACLAPLLALQVRKKVDVHARAHGGGITGQAGAVRLGLGRALIGLYPDAHDTLREEGHLTRDPRMVERKKYGRHKARRGHQWGKR